MVAEISCNVFFIHVGFFRGKNPSFVLGLLVRGPGLSSTHSFLEELGDLLFQRVFLSKEPFQISLELKME